MQPGRLLGQGSYAQVVVASVSRTDPTLVAVKRFNKPYSNRHLASWVLRELHVLHDPNLLHPHIIPLMEVRMTENGPELLFPILTPFIPAHVEADHRWILARQLVGAVNHLHAHGFMHRDLKPGNLLLKPTLPPHIYVIDLGTARPISTKHTLGVTTLEYEAPELMMGVERYGAEVDAWSVGCILFELLLTRRLHVQSATEEGFARWCTLQRWLGDVNVEEWRILPLWTDLSQALSEARENPPAISGAPLTRHLNASAPDSDTYHGFRLVQRLLDINPRTRCTLKEALRMQPLAESIELLDTPEVT